MHQDWEGVADTDEFWAEPQAQKRERSRELMKSDRVNVESQWVLQEQVR